MFLDKVGDIHRHEGFNKALKHPQLRAGEAAELVFDHRFCELFRSLDREVTGIVMKRESPFVVNGSGRESVEDGGGGTGSVAAEQLRAEIEQYKQFIRELAGTRVAVEEMRQREQELRDQNSILQAQAIN